MALWGQSQPLGSREQPDQDVLVHVLDHSKNHADGGGHADHGVLTEGVLQPVHDVIPDGEVHEVVHSGFNQDGGVHADDGLLAEGGVHPDDVMAERDVDRGDNVADEDGFAESSIHADDGLQRPRPTSTGTTDNGGGNVANDDDHQALPDDGGSILADDGAMLKASDVLAEGGVESSNQQDGDHVCALEHSGSMQEDDHQVRGLANMVRALAGMVQALIDDGTCEACADDADNGELARCCL